jgi:hypothetical protein
VARRVDDFELDASIVLIDDERDTTPDAVAAWLATLKRLEPVNPTISGADLIREIRTRGEE